MSEHFKRGDLAVVTARWRYDKPHSEARAVRSGQGWERLCDLTQVGDHETSEVRRLVVIDPEDANRVNVLWHLLEDAMFEGGKGWGRTTGYERREHLTTALREFIGSAGSAATTSDPEIAAVLPVIGPAQHVSRITDVVDARRPVTILGHRYIADPDTEPALRYTPAEACAMRDALRRLDRSEGRSS